jgi:hypothetical protein
MVKKDKLIILKRKMKYDNSNSNIATNDVDVGSSILNISNSSRTSDDGLNTFSNQGANKEHLEEIDSYNDEINVNIFRFKFKDEFARELYNFAKIHQYDHRKDFKDAWKVWMDENTEMVDEEVRRLTNLRYEGDILDKMFKSARYYFRKKGTEKKEPAKRRVYHGVQKELLEAIDEHIKSNINSKEYKPSVGFDRFCVEYLELVKEEVGILFKSGFTNSNEIKNKIKKTYKNRYFLFISK